MRRLLVCFALAATFGWLSPVEGQQQQQVFRVNFANDEIRYNVASGDGDTTLGLWIVEDSTSPGFPNMVAGWSMSMSIDPAKVTVVDVDHGAYVATINGGGPPGFWTVNTSVGGFTVGCVYDLFGGAICFYDVPKEAAKVTLETVPSAFAGDTVGDSVDLNWTPLGQPPVDNLFVMSNGSSVQSSAANGMLDVLPSGVSFLRGDADGNGTLSAITDAVLILNYLFNSGAMPCLDAADFNDDGAINLPDPVAALNWGFNMGAAPTAPFPACGTDPTMDALDCATAPACP